DHGRGLPRGKRWVYESGIHVPLIIRGPGKLRPGSVRDDLVSFIDFAPTVLALAGVEVLPAMQGQPFTGPGARARRYVFAALDRWIAETRDMGAIPEQELTRRGLVRDILSTYDAHKRTDVR